jgi:hypothetical protein
MYYVVEQENTNALSDAVAGSNMRVLGPYSSITKAKQAIVGDAVDAFDNENVGDPEDWGSRMTIVQSIITLRPVPEITVEMKLREVK